MVVIGQLAQSTASSDAAIPVTFPGMLSRPFSFPRGGEDVSISFTRIGAAETRRGEARRGETSDQSNAVSSWFCCGNGGEGVLKQSWKIDGMYLLEIGFFISLIQVTVLKISSKNNMSFSPTLTHNREYTHTSIRVHYLTLHMRSRSLRT